MSPESQSSFAVDYSTNSGTTSVYFTSNLPDQDYRNESDDEGGDGDVLLLERALDAVDDEIDDDDDQNEHLLKAIENARWKIITVPNVGTSRISRNSPVATGFAKNTNFL